MREFEVLVVDDGSTDNTEGVVRRYPGIRYVYQANAGQASARNVAIRSARGMYVAFLDADDIWAPEKLDIQVQLFKEHPDLVWQYSDAMLFDDATRRTLCRVSDRVPLYSGDILKPLFVADFISTASVIVRRDVFADVGLFCEYQDWRSCEDWDMWLRIAARYHVGLVRSPLTKIRIRAASSSHNANLAWRHRAKMAIVRAALHRTPDRLAPLLPRATGNVYMATGKQMLAKGCRFEAREMFFLAVRVQPLSMSAHSYLVSTVLPSTCLRALYELRKSYNG
jgi:glycosyltransferase involved in cell wall biosynthesis